MPSLRISGDGNNEGPAKNESWFHIMGPALSDVDFQLVQDKIGDTLFKLTEHLFLNKETDDA